MESLGEFAAYQGALDFLASRINYERATVAYRASNFKLDRMRRLLDRLGNPQRQLRAIHIAGTKGKGSTAAMIASVLLHAGYRVGLYTSPHLESVEERIQVGGAACSGAELAELVGQVRPVVEAMDGQGDGSRPTYFEVTTAMAMLHFAHAAVDLAVLEVGLGGRLDSTNVCHPLVSVITSISYDHMRQLGNTLTEIAREKSGIIKPGVPVVSGAGVAEAEAVVERVAARNRCPLLRLGRDFDFELTAAKEPGEAAELAAGTRLDYWQRPPHGAAVRLPGLQLALAGRHQAANAAIAIATLGRVAEAGWPVSAESIRAGLAAARCPARIELLRRDPLVVLDAAHNVASIEALVRTLDELGVAQPSRTRPRVAVFSTSKDKDCAGMLRHLLPAFDRLIFTQFRGNPRAVEAGELYALAQSLDEPRAAEPPASARLVVHPEPQVAWQAAWTAMPPPGLICIAGSFFLAAELRRAVLASLPGHAALQPV